MPRAMQTTLFLLRRWGPAILMMGLIFTASSIPASSFPSWSGWVDLLLKKGGHMLGYGLLALAVLRGVGGDTKLALRKTLIWVLVYAITDEVHQRFVPGRGPSVLDVLIDGIGASAALLIYKARASNLSDQSSNSSSNSSSSSHPSAGVR
jgi:VanZ family protein